MIKTEVNYGPYVVIRPRKDGTKRVALEIPKRLRPEGWPSTILLPSTNLRPEMKQRKVVLWEQDDVNRMVEASLACNQPGIAKIILIEWEIGRRLGDALKFRYGIEYIDGMFRLYQSKTNSYVTIPVSGTLRAMLDADKIDGGFLIINSINGLPFSGHGLSVIFAAIRNSVPEYKTRRITLRDLRHSCVVQLARAQRGIYEIASITGHSFNTVRF